LGHDPTWKTETVRRLVSLVVLALALAPAAAGDVGEIYYPVATFEPVGDPSAHGYVSWSLNLRPNVRTFCWEELSIVTKRQALFVYLRRGPVGRVVGTIDVRPNNPLPWDGSGTYSGCDQRPRALVLDIHAHPGRYYLDVRTRGTAHALRARLHGPPIRRAP
jgi:hypothetical protein